MGNWEDYLEGNYDEKGNLIKKYKQRKDDEHQAKEIEEQIEKMYEYYKKREDIKEYLMDGADLQCNQATLEPFEMSDGTVIKLEFDEETEAGNEEKKITRIKRRQTELQVTSNTQTTDNGSLHATVFDCIQGENIHSFKCNCKLVDDREEEYWKIKDDSEVGKAGVCKHLMKLGDRWENFPIDENYKTITVQDSEDESKEKIMECITMTSVLFCKHGGLITPVNSGQTEEMLGKRTMAVSNKLINLLKCYETGMDRDGNYLAEGEPALYPYHSPSDDPNVLTIAWGHAMRNEEEGWFTFSNGVTINLYSMRKEDGTNVSSITKEQANEILEKDIAVREETLNVVIESKGIEYKVNQQFYDALFLLTYQMGTDYLTNGGSLSEFLEDENFDLNDIEEIKKQFGDFTNGLEKGTMRRRADEIDIILKNEYTRDEDETRYGDIWRKKTYPDMTTPGY